MMSDKHQHGLGAELSACSSTSVKYQINAKAALKVFAKLFSKSGTALPPGATRRRKWVRIVQK